MPSSQFPVEVPHNDMRPQPMYIVQNANELLLFTQRHGINIILIAESYLRLSIYLSIYLVCYRADHPSNSCRPVQVRREITIL